MRLGPILLLLFLTVSIALVAGHPTAHSQTPTPIPTPTDTPTPTATATPTATPSPTPTATPAPTGSISGRVYIDVDANGEFDGPDVGWAGAPMSLEGPPHGWTSVSDSGEYIFTALPEGTYTIYAANFPIPLGCEALPPFNWIGGAQDLSSCPSGPALTTRSRTVELAEGEHLTGIDFPQVPPTSVSGRVWLDGQPATKGSEMLITVGGASCWTTTLQREVTPAGITIANFASDLDSIDAPQCQNSDLGAQIDGRELGISIPWDEFWIDQLWPDRRGSLDRRSQRTKDLLAPPFAGLSGQIIEPESINSSAPGGELVEDGTSVRAIIGDIVCGEAMTKTLEAEFGGAMNLFGLIVLPAEIEPGCGEEGARITFCAGSFKAEETMIHDLYLRPPGRLATEPLSWRAGELQSVSLERTDEPCTAVLGFPPTGSEQAASGSRWSHWILAGALLASSAAFMGLAKRRS